MTERSVDPRGQGSGEGICCSWALRKLEVKELFYNLIVGVVTVSICQNSLNCTSNNWFLLCINYTSKS